MRLIIRDIVVLAGVIYSTCFYLLIVLYLINIIISNIFIYYIYCSRAFWDKRISQEVLGDALGEV
jgi:hypothetical protein